jgi:hypothetical protein
MNAVRDSSFACAKRAAIAATNDALARGGTVVELVERLTCALWWCVRAPQRVNAAVQSVQSVQTCT